MSKKENLEIKYSKMLDRFTKGHSDLKHLKEDMRRLRILIGSTPANVEIRPDEENMKNLTS